MNKIIGIVSVFFLIVVLIGCTSKTEMPVKMSKLKHSTSFTFEQPAEVMFPLFTAEGEKLWAPGWDYQNIMGYTEQHENYVFVTKAHGHASSDAIWLVKQYDPKSYFVEYYKVEPKTLVSIVTVKCTKITDHSTQITVGYEYIGLSKKGNEFIEEHRAKEKYKSYIQEWKKHLLIYFKSKG